MRLKEWMAEQGFDPAAVTFSQLISQCDRTGGSWEEAMLLFDDMEVRINGQRALIACCLQHAKQAAALHSLEEGSGEKERVAGHHPVPSFVLSRSSFLVCAGHACQARCRDPDDTDQHLCKGGPMGEGD